MLFLREGGLPELADTPDLRGGRTGEVSREGLGELADEVFGTTDVVEALFKMGGVDGGCCGFDATEAEAEVEASLAFTSDLLFSRSSSTVSAEWETPDAMIQRRRHGCCSVQEKRSVVDRVRASAAIAVGVHYAEQHGRIPVRSRLRFVNKSTLSLIAGAGLRPVLQCDKRASSAVREWEEAIVRID